MSWELGTDLWNLRVPAGITTRHEAIEPPADTDLTSMAIARGWLSDSAPATIIVTTRPRTAWTLRKLARHLGQSYDEDVGDGRPFEVSGAHGARRLDGRHLREEGVSPDGVEHMTVVVAASREEMIVLTVRTPFEDPVLEQVETIIASLEVQG